MSKKGLLSYDKRKITRVVYVVSLPPEYFHEASGVKRDQILALESDIKNDLSSSIEKIWKDSFHEIHSVTLKLFSSHGDSKNVLDHIHARYQQHTRVVVDLIGLEQCDDAFLKKTNISHLITLKINEKKQDWVSGYDLGVCVVSLPLSNIKYLIHDIFLDIAMFHSYPYLSMQYTATPEARKSFINLKATFCNSLKFNSYYAHKGAIDNYVPFGALCRSSEGFDFNKYVKLWNDFISTLVVEEPPRKKYEHTAVESISKYHRFGGQLSLSKLSNVIGDLSKGTYLLITTNVRPKMKSDRKKIASKIGRSIWRQKCWIIRPFNKFSEYSTCSPFLSFFKFSIK